MDADYNNKVNALVPGLLDNLNVHNGADKPLLQLASRVLEEFPKEHVYGVEMGIAYGGGVERIGKLWKGRGTIYGMDTFIGHPEHLAVDASSDEARCMDHWYRPEILGKDKLAYEYQRGVLDSEGLDNVILVKGEVNKDSCKDIPKIHYALMDMDMLVSTKNGYEALKNKIVKGGYLCLHDVIPPVHLGGYLYNWWYNDTMKQDGYEIVEELPGSHLGIYRKL